MAKTKTILKWAVTALWIVMGSAVLVLLVAAIKKNDHAACTGVNVVIKGVSDNFFVDKKDILNELNQYIDGAPEGQPLSSFNLRSLENDLQKNIWVKKAQLFFDNNQVLQIVVTEREPAARLFTATGATFYIDSSIAMLPLNEKYSARLPVFTNFPSDKAVLTKADSALLREVYHLSMAIQQDSFLMALIEQIDITPHRNFEMIPKIGNGVIAFGDGADIEKKFKKLKLFYEQVMPQSGWNYYSKIDVQYAGQIVAKRKGAEDKTADSLRTLQLLHAIAQTAEHLANDSLQMILQDNEFNTTSTNLVEQSMERDEEMDAANMMVEKMVDESLGKIVKANAARANPAPVKKAGVATAKPGTAVPEKPVSKPAAKPVASSKPALAKPVIKKPVAKPAASAQNKPAPVPAKANTQKPKAVMQQPKANDY